MSKFTDLEAASLGDGTGRLKITAPDPLAPNIQDTATGLNVAIVIDHAVCTAMVSAYNRAVASVGADKATDERALFETWYSQRFAGGHVANMSRRANGEYHHAQAEIAWQSCRAAFAAVPASEPVRLMNFGADGPAPWSGARVEMLLEVIRMVRQYPDFDADDSPFGVMMDEALVGKTPALLGTIDSLANGRMPQAPDATNSTGETK